MAVVGERISGLVDRGTRALLCAKSTVASLLLTACLAMIGVGLIACQSPADGCELRELALQPDAVTDPESQPNEKPQNVDVHGDPLPKEALARLGTLRFRPGGFVSSLVFAPDAKTLVSLGTDGNVCVFDTQDGRAVRRFRAGGIPGQSALSADGRWIATLVGKDFPFNPEVSVDLWDISTAQKIITFGKGPFVSATFSADGKTLAVLRYDNVVELWDIQTGRVLRNWKTSDEPGYDLTLKGRFTQDGKTLVTKHRMQGYRSWDVASGRPLQEFKDLYMSHLFAVSSRGILAVDRRDPTAEEPKKDTPAEVQLRLIDLAAGKDLSHLAASTAPGPYGRLTGVSCGEFSPDGKLLVTAGYDRQIRLWDVAMSKQIRSWSFIAATPMALRFSADGKRIALTEGGMSIRLLDVTDCTEIATPSGNNTGYFHSRFCPDGESVLTLNSFEHTLHSWDLTTGRLRRRQELPAEETARSNLSRDGATVFSWSLDGDLRACDSVTGKDVRRLGKHEMPYGHFIVPSADGKMLALVGQSPAIVLADAITGKETRRITAHTPWPIGAAFSADCKSLTSWGVDGKAQVWDLATGQEIREIPFTEGPEPAPDPFPAGPGPVAAPGRNSLIIFSAAVSPDGRTLAFGSRRGFIAIHETATGEEVRRLEKLPTGVSEMPFSPDVRMLAWSGTEDRKCTSLRLPPAKSATFSPAIWEVSSR